METVLIIAAIWLIIAGVYGAWPYFRAFELPRGRSTGIFADRDLTRRYNEQITAAAAALAQPAAPQAKPPARATVGGLFSEVDMLRAQVEQLRSEIVALSSAAPLQRPERPRLRRYRTGFYTYLPRPLRQQVQEVRLSRRAVHV